jgi:hypothetical protein
MLCASDAMCCGCYVLRMPSAHSMCFRFCAGVLGFAPRSFSVGQLECCSAACVSTGGALERFGVRGVCIVQDVDSAVQACRARAVFTLHALFFCSVVACCLMPWGACRLVGLSAVLPACAVACSCRPGVFVSWSAAVQLEAPSRLGLCVWFHMPPWFPAPIPFQAFLL